MKRIALTLALALLLTAGALQRAAASVPMNGYLVLVLLLVPSGNRGDVLRTELHRELLSASAQHVCQRHADKLAEEQRRLHADLIQRTRGRVAGVCIELKDPE